MKALCWLLLLLAPAVAAAPAGDPMAPPPALQQGRQAASDEVAELRLQQVVQGGTPRAAINGRWLRLGERRRAWPSPSRLHGLERPEDHAEGARHTHTRP